MDVTPKIVLVNMHISFLNSSVANGNVASLLSPLKFLCRSFLLLQLSYCAGKTEAFGALV